MTKIRPISSEEWENLQNRFTYPEKYWKLANYYFSHNKAWISGKNTEKLEKVIAQKKIWGDFPKTALENPLSRACLKRLSARWVSQFVGDFARMRAP